MIVCEGISDLSHQTAAGYPRRITLTKQLQHNSPRNDPSFPDKFSKVGTKLNGTKATRPNTRRNHRYSHHRTGTRTPQPVAMSTMRIKTTPDPTIPTLSSKLDRLEHRKIAVHAELQCVRRYVKCHTLFAPSHSLSNDLRVHTSEDVSPSRQLGSSPTLSYNSRFTMSRSGTHTPFLCMT